MKVSMFIVVASLFVTAAQAAQIEGTIKRFSGRTVETGRPYSYNALETVTGERLELPAFIHADKGLINKSVRFEASEVATFCTDMSRACTTGKITDVKEFYVVLSMSEVMMQSFSGPIKHYTGRAVESARTYDYFAINANGPVAVPAFLDAGLLLNAKANVTVTGVSKANMCTDMSLACGPTQMSLLGMVDVKIP